MDKKLPECFDRKHPLFTQQYAIFTPAIADLGDQIGNWIDQKVTGAYIYGPSRFGKSRGAQSHLHRMLSERFECEIPLIIWSRQGMSRTASMFYSELLEAAKHPYASSNSNALKKLIKFKTLLSIAVKKRRLNFAILVVDEAQSMTDMEWQWLIGLQNLLDSEHLRLVVVSIGSHQMDYDYSVHALTGNAHIAARFHAVSARFNGLRSKAELAYVLNGYDEDSEWPEGSNTSYTVYAAGKQNKLTESTDRIWEALLALSPQDYRGMLQFPMQHVARAVERVLLNVVQGQDWGEATTDKAWERVISDTGFKNYMRLVTATPLNKYRRGG